jgi:hypothetical protein
VFVAWAVVAAAAAAVKSLACTFVAAAVLCCYDQDGVAETTDTCPLSGKIQFH